MLRQVFLAVLIACIFLLFLWSNSSPPKEVLVEIIVDGDTFKSGKYTIRLLGIDSPEKGQMCYKEAKEFLKKLIENKTVKLEYDSRKKDSYGRLLAYVWIDDIFVNEEMIKNGFAVFRDYGEVLKYEKILNISKTGCVANIDTCEECIGVSYFEWDPKGDDCEGGEFVKLKNFCEFSCNLTGWKVSDAHGNEFELLHVMINHTLYLRSGCGENSENEIYLCPKRKCKALWNNDGDSFLLYNKNGELVINLTYS